MAFSSRFSPPGPPHLGHILICALSLPKAVDENIQDIIGKLPFLNATELRECPAEWFIECAGRLKKVQLEELEQQFQFV